MPMIFPAHDPFDTMGQATLRHVSMAALKRIDKVRNDYLATCDNRPGLQDLDRNERLVRFGGLLLAANALAKANNVPGADPDQFLESIGKKEQKPKPLADMVRRFLGETKSAAEADEALRMTVSAGLQGIPGFDRDAFLEGSGQSHDFHEELKIDFPVIREMAFEMRKPFTFLLECEDHIDTIAPIYRRFESASFAGVDVDALEAFVKKPAERALQPEI